MGRADWFESGIISVTGRALFYAARCAQLLRVEDRDATSGECHQTSIGKCSQVPGDNFPGGAEVSGNGFVGFFYPVFRIGRAEQETSQAGFDGQRLYLFQRGDQVEYPL